MSRVRALAVAQPLAGGRDPLLAHIARACHALATLIGRMPAAQHELASAHAFMSAMAAAHQTSLHLVSGVVGAAPPREPLERLVDALGLTATELDLLVLAGLAEEHEGIASVLATLHPQSQPFATTGLAAQLLCTELHERVRLRETLAQGVLRDSGALTCEGDGPFFTRSLTLAPELWAVLRGIDVWPGALHPVLRTSRAGLGAWLQGSEASHIAGALQSERACVLQVLSDEPASAAARVAAAAAAVGLDCVQLRVAAPLTVILQQQALLHAIVRGAIPIFVADGDDAEVPAEIAPAVAATPIVLCTRGHAATPRGQPVIRVQLTRLPIPERTALWRELMPELGESAAVLGRSYTIEAPLAEEAAGDARVVAGVEKREVAAADVIASLRARTQTRLATGLSARRPTASWEQLVLPEDRKAQLREAVNRLRYQEQVLDEWGFLRGNGGARGVRMLFAGPPGTGKTLAAEVLAHALGMDLLTVDLSKIVSKWLGETEKQLSDVFDCAERTRAVLLFDEADALFGRRTEVQDAHDRYANLETAYLLTRLERFDGLSVMSTNLQRNIDSAFMRRIEFIVEFDEPAVRDRIALWKCHLPPGAPLADDVDLKELATMYPIVGGHIRNAATAAAFLAAAHKSPINRVLLIRAIRREYQKAGRAFPGTPHGVADL